jgi:IS30 family transposase
MPGPRLSIGERDFIQAGLRADMSCRAIAAELGRAPSTVSREIRRNRGLRGYRSCVAQYRAHERARRPKAFKLERHRELACRVARLLRRRWSPEQIAARLRRDHADDPRWWVSPEAIYRALYVQARGAMRQELARYLRSGRSRRKPQHDNKRGRLKDMAMIAVRPPEVDDRAVPGHWEGDLLLGTGGHSQVGMLTERTTRFTLLFALPHDRTAPTVRRALGRTIRKLPDHLARTVTWDQGKELAEHTAFTIATNVDVFFCDPASPWQRGTAENTVGLLRQYLPKNGELSQVTQRQLDRIATELNERPRKILGWDSPAEAYAHVVGVATTG